MFVIYIFTDSTRARFRGKRVKNIPRSWVWADRFPFNDLFHAIIYFIAWINVDSSLSRGHWKLENWKENDNFFFNFLEFSILQRKNFIYHSIKKKKIPSNFINKFPVQQMFSRDHPFLSSRKSMLSHTIEYQKIDEENFFIIIFFFFFFQISHAFHFQWKLCASLGKISLNFRSSTTTIISFVASLIHRSHIPSNTRKLHSTRVNGRVF